MTKLLKPKNKFKSSNYVTILGWMVNELHLSANKLLIYAIIHSFSQDGEGCFTGSLLYLQKWTGKSRTTVLSILTELLEDGLIEKEEIPFSRSNPSKHYCKYWSCRSRVNSADEVNKTDTKQN